jgi:hypothetical protein
MHTLVVSNGFVLFCFSVKKQRAKTKTVGGRVQCMMVLMHKVDDSNAKNVNKQQFQEY